MPRTNLHDYFASLTAVCFATGALSAPSQAQHGANDSSFNAQDSARSGPGASNWVFDLAHQPDGKSLIAGAFATYNGVQRPVVVRVHQDGGVDTSFWVDAPTALSVDSLALQPDGKVVLGGEFSNIGGVARSRIARVHSNGSLDLGFAPGAGADATVRDVAVQPNGKVLVAGAFTTVDNVARKSIARLNSDGSLDTSFDPGVGPLGEVNALVLRSDGTIVICGNFSMYAGVTRRCVARLNSDGSLDTTFDPGLGVFGAVYDLAEQPDGKLVIGGFFDTVHTFVRNRIARLHPNGALDTSFTPGAGAVHAQSNQPTVDSIALAPDGKIVVGGNFTSFGGVGRNYLARLNANGVVDTTFDPGSGADGRVFVASVRSNGKVLLGGTFKEYSARRRSFCTQANPDGSLDTSFNPNSGASDRVTQIVPLSTGKTLIAGAFLDYNDVPRRGIARLDADGALDASFDPGAGANGPVEAMTVQPDGRILIAGGFTSVAGAPRPRLARLLPDGAVDPSFVTTSGPSSAVYDIALQPDGALVIGGAFQQYGGVSQQFVTRVAPDGSLAPNFQSFMGANNVVNNVALAPDGKILIAGVFTSYGGHTSRRIARLHADGSADTSFVGQVGPGSNQVLALELLSDGRMLIGGSFTQYGAMSRGGIARIEADGALDPSFDPGLGLGGGGTATVYSLTRQSNGDVLIAGQFDSFDGVARSSLVRVRDHGALDANFDPGQGARYGAGNSAPIRTLALQADGKALIGGDFLYYDQAVRHHLARVFAQDSNGVAYCTAGTSTNGCSATISGVGAPSASAAAGFTLHVAGVEGAKQGLIYYGVSGNTTSTWGAGGTSFQCVKPPTQRTGAQSTGGTAGLCDGVLATDWLAYIASHPSALGTPLTVGAVVNAQAWYRDPTAVKTTNLSNALEFVISP